MNYKVIGLICTSILATGLSFVIQSPKYDALSHNMEKHDVESGGNMQRLERRKRSGIVDKDVDISMSDIDKAIEKMNGLNKQFAGMVDLWDNYHLLKADAVKPESPKDRNNDDEDYESREEEKEDYESEEEDKDLREERESDEEVDPDEYANISQPSEDSIESDGENENIKDGDSKEEGDEIPKMDDKDSTKKENELDLQKNKSSTDDSNEKSNKMDDTPVDKEGDSIESGENEDLSDEAESEEESEEDEDYDGGSEEDESQDENDEDIDV